MGIASAMTKVTMSQSNSNSKTQIKKKEQALKNPTKYIACKICHATNITLIKGPDSYYCKFCYEKVVNKNNKTK